MVGLERVIRKALKKTKLTWQTIGTPRYAIALSPQAMAVLRAKAELKALTCSMEAKRFQEVSQQSRKVMEVGNWLCDYIPENYINT